ncbi:unnamed protein product [Didymodactylos carnosus]|uniref:DUF6570 domain-containing protein n=1 Tax=Didymodactylos carnosus TaxID=1234261 RepID=A0A815Y4B3_9BILA|nr:unnamed protein product [Didymodactylos carnosus]CAF1565181.1 unnamed protein product [Didymodactylos carnosus]CAF3634567.1 unnamed protein product [Didymodactylos carnosus]CAF4427182.1 unnamed protein product [Didymodactylos carnosus]
MCSANGLEFPLTPSKLKDLTALESRLAAARLPFMKVRGQIDIGQQYRLAGNVVNAPAATVQTVNGLPRKCSQEETISVKLKIKKAFRHHVFNANIRPAA